MAWAELTDVRCYYELLGQGEPLLLIPGLGVTSSVWDPVACELAEHFSLILMDNRGMGRSEAKREPCTLNDYCSDIVELLDHLQVERAHVLGLSLGGVIAHRLAIYHGCRISRLVLASCTDHFTPYLTHVATMLGQTLRRLRSRAFARTIEVMGSSPRYVDGQPEMIEQRIREKCAQNIPPRAIGRQLRCLAASDGELTERVNAPTLVISGEHDFLIPSCYGREMAQRIPGSRFELIPAAGHNPMVECPEQVLPMIIDFLKESKGLSPTAPKAKKTAERFTPMQTPGMSVATGGGTLL